MPFDDLQVIERVLKVRDAEGSLLAFAHITMPDPSDPGDPRLSEYEAADHHRYLAGLYEQALAERWPYLIVNAPPSHGKSELGTRRLAAWFVGRNPGKHVMVGCYNEAKATDFRDEILAILKSDEFRQVFPDVWVVKQSSDRIDLSTGSKLYFVGRGNSATGRHADLILIDDPIKDAKEARSEIVRTDLWKWWVTTISTRRRTQHAVTMVTQTRWTEDDLTGRLSDPSNAFYSKRRGKKVKVVNLPALAEDDDPMGRKPGDPLWPGRFDKDFLEEKQEEDASEFASLYQGRPAPDEGIFYTTDILDPCEYDRDGFPTDDNLRFYGASDHAVQITRMNDLTCILPFAIDRDGTGWILDDIFWSRMTADVAVENIIQIMKAHRPATWFSAKGVIDAAIGPFLRNRMIAEGCYTNLEGFAEMKDKVHRAHSARALVAQRRLRFPKYASWWPKAREQLLKFPNGSKADFVDTLSLIGLAIDQTIAGSQRPVQPKEPAPGTFGAMLKQFQKPAASIRRGGW